MTSAYIKLGFYWYSIGHGVHAQGKNIRMLTVVKLVTMSTHRAKISGCYIFQVNFDLSFSQDLSEVVCSHFFFER